MLFSAAVGTLTDSASRAAERLDQLLAAESESVSLGAAKAILELGPRLRDQSEIEERVLTLEEIANGKDKD